MAQSETTLPTRVSVLEHSVAEVKSGLDSHRGETRTAFASLQVVMESIRSDTSKAGKPTNWYGLISSAAAAVVIVGAIFGLAEWRMTNGVLPLVEAAREARVAIRKTTDEVVELRIKQGVMEAEHARVKIEQEARIRARVEAEQRAQERLVQPPIGRSEK